MPALTQERRQELVKLVKKMAEEAKVALRAARRDANEMLKDVPEGRRHHRGRRAHGAEERAGDHGQVAVAKVDELLAKKEGEILEV